MARQQLAGVAGVATTGARRVGSAYGALRGIEPPPRRRPAEFVVVAFAAGVLGAIAVVAAGRVLRAVRAKLSGAEPGSEDRIGEELTQPIPASSSQLQAVPGNIGVPSA